MYLENPMALNLSKAEELDRIVAENNKVVIAHY